MTIEMIIAIQFVVKAISVHGARENLPGFVELRGADFNNPER
jgi:hypothetical protein